MSKTIKFLATVGLILLAVNIEAGEVKYFDKYVYRLAFEEIEREDKSLTILRVYFANQKNARGKTKAIGNCHWILSFIGERPVQPTSVLFQLAHTAYLEQKKVSVICESADKFFQKLKEVKVPNSNGMIEKFVLKSLD